MGQPARAEFSLAEVVPPFEDDMATVLRVDSMSVSFGGVVALRDVSFDLVRGDVLAVVGPNGAGKTTLLNCVCGLVRGTPESVIGLSGTELRGKTPAAIARLGIGRSFQDPQLVEAATVIENVMIGAFIAFEYSMFDQCVRRGRVKRLETAARDRAIGLLETVGLAADRDRVVAELPYGARKLVDIVRAMMSAPRLLLLDEPTSGLDLSEQRLVTDLLRALRDEPGATVGVVEHHMDVVREVATKVIGLQAGTILATGSPSEVLDSAAFREAIVGVGAGAGAGAGSAEAYVPSQHEEM